MRNWQATHLSRIALLVSSLVYAATLNYCLSNYAATEWAMYGYSYRVPTQLDLMLMVLSILVWSFSLPTTINRPSALFLVVIYIFVCLPAVVLMLGLATPREDLYYPLLISILLGFFTTCCLTNLTSWRPGGRSSHPYFANILVTFWIILFFFLIYSFGAIMSFSTLDLIYEQRESGAAQNLLQGYAQTYFGYVISPAILVFGLLRSNWLQIVLGLLGALILYAITAEKAVFTYPILIYLLHSILGVRYKIFLNTAALICLVSVLLSTSVYMAKDNSVAAFISWYLGVRSLLTPGAFIAFYYDYFSETSYTYFSHISGISMFIDRPTIFSASSRWPSIGHMLGENYLGIADLNANANFIASDGVASFGIVGVLFSFAFLAIFLIILDRSSNGIPTRLVLPILLPLSLTLTNGSLFTSLTSFGGIFWIICFVIAFKKPQLQLW